MSKSDLQEWLLENAGFQVRFRRLVIDSVARQFSKLRRPSAQQEEFAHDWGYFLLCASLLAQSENGKCQDAALRIAQFCLEQNEVNPTHKDAAAVILDTLANQPSIELAQKRNLLEGNVSDRLSFPLLQDWIKRSIENSVTLGNLEILAVNHFQRRFWEGAKQESWISISAPTSAGKSFILGHWLAEYLRISPNATVVYLVPTRALIQQVQRDLEHLLAKESILSVAITTLPLRSSYRAGVANVFVFTQERFHILLGERGASLHLDLLIVDEAQKIGDNYRGVLLQQAIETTAHQNPQCRVVFASPMTDNPDVLVEDAPADASRGHITSEDTMVNQNLLWASQVPLNPMLWNIELILDATPESIGQVQLPARLSHISKRLPFVTFTLADPQGGNIVYVNGAAAAETAAKQLYDLLGSTASASADQEIQELVELIQKTIHRQYSLASVLSRGVAFHYGNMPLLVRTEVERLFRLNKIKYLVCTSTLIEGVNMPCESVFLRGPKKGLKPMAPSDFWNLAGRAGRWGREFQGNVICVDARDEKIWTNGAPKRKAKFTIKRTADEVLDQPQELLTFIEEGTPRKEAAKHPNLEYVFSYLMSSYILNGSIADAPWARRFSEEIVCRVSESIERCARSLSTPKDVILRNPGISPIAMDTLLRYFEERTENSLERLDELLPVLPESEDAFDVYTEILHRINEHLAAEFGNAKRVRQLAHLIVDWMRGHSLSRIIYSREHYYGSDKLASLIRNTMKDVEEVARFQAPKFLACYIDLLRVFLEQKERRDLIERLFEINVLLEFGVSQGTQLSLIGLGLSRSSAINLSELITEDSLSEEACLTWIRENDWMTADMPAIIKREICTLLGERTAD